MKRPHWKASGKDGVQGYWIKNLGSLYNGLLFRRTSLMRDGSLPAWMTHGHTGLGQKDPRGSNAVESYRPITCLPLMWKLLTKVIDEEMYDYLEQEKLLPEEQKGFQRGSITAKDQLLIDKTVLKYCKKRHTNLSMAWIDYKKVNDFITHSWIDECMELFENTDNVKMFLEKSMEQWKLSLTSYDKDLEEFDVRSGIFWRDNLSLLLFVLSKISLSLILER